MKVKVISTSKNLTKYRPALEFFHLKSFRKTGSFIEVRDVSDLYILQNDIKVLLGLQEAPRISLYFKGDQATVEICD